MLSFFALLMMQGGQPPTAAKGKAEVLSSKTLSGLRFRSIGPALASGRISALAIHPKDRSHYFAAAASSGIWKTTNSGTTWTPVFDGEASYSIGALAMDPKNPNVIWAGTGENNSQRSVGYGDGVYKSTDGGKTWTNMGLKSSEHIAAIVIDPRDSDVAYVASQGPLWGPGGERGLFKTHDGGKTWTKVLNISENTGVTDLVMDPRDPDLLIAATYQRRRHVWTLINGGPESAIHRSTNGGRSWTKVTSGLPGEALGRIGLAMAPTDPDTVYAIVESIDKKGGIFRSTDRGVTWEKRNDFDAQAQYYARLYVDPKNKDRLYVMNVYIMVSNDGGKTLSRLGERWKHVDSHCLWIDPENTNFYLCGCDGGVYESFDRGANWVHKTNLPITQFYDVTCDESGPFYHVYGGTQDNNTLGGPVRTRSIHGIVNSDWFVVLGGDGFQCRVDPTDPNIVYAEAQYGILVRYDRRTGQKVSIQPQGGKGDPPLRWNWDSAMIISPHAPKRLYFAANKVFRSDDRGDSWRAISGDLTRQIERDTLPVMGKVWGPDAVAKHLSTSYFGNIVQLAESPKRENRLYVGTDDGLIHVTDNAGGEWRKIEKFPTVPDKTYVTRIVPSQHSADVVYASFDNHKNADFLPYALKSTDAGKTWTSMVGDLPKRGSVLAIAEDHVNPNLLFVGTEFALFVTLDGGKKWLQLKGGLPTIPCKDIAIQRPMNDLVLGTFGRGFYILDDYAPLRTTSAESLAKPATMFPVRDAVLFIPSTQYGLRGKGFLGEAFYSAPNPAFGATFTYHLKDEIKSKKQKRRDAEKEAEKKTAKFDYPTKDSLRAEAEEEPPTMLLTIADAAGKPVRAIRGPVTAGVHRVTWDLREPAVVPPRPRPPELADDLFVEEPSGNYAFPGKYSVSMAQRVDGVVTPVAEPQAFAVLLDKQVELPDADQRSLAEFQGQVAALTRSVSSAVSAAGELATKLEAIRGVLDQTPKADLASKNEVRRMLAANRAILRVLRGDEVLAARNENTPTTVSERVGFIVGTQRSSLSAPGGHQRENYRIASEELTDELKKLRQLKDVDLPKLEKALEAAGAPWTPGRLPD